MVFSEMFFRTTQEKKHYLFCRAKREFFFQNLTLGYMTKTLDQIIFYSSTNKTDLHDKTVILLNVALNTISQSKLCENSTQIFLSHNVVLSTPYNL
jgi:hypothetical protein